MFTLKNEKLWIKVTLISIAVFVLLISAYAVIKYGNYFLLGDLEKLNNDDVRYIRTAKVLLEKHVLIDDDIHQPTIAEMPGHAFSLAFFFKLFGYDSGLTAFRLFQALLQALSVFLVFFISREVFNSKVGIIACAINALYVPEISVTGLVLMEVTFKFLLLLLIYLSILAVKTKQPKYYILGGIVWALDCLFRPTIAAFPLIVLVLWLIFRYSFKEMVKFGAITSLVFCLVMSPWWVRNYLTFDRFIPLALASGNPFLQGTYINYDQSKDPIGYIPGNNAIKQDEIEMKTGINRLKKNFPKQPLEYIHWYTLGKSKFFWQNPYYWRKVFGISYNIARHTHRLILLTGFLGLIIALRRRHRDSAFVLSIILYFNIMHLPYFTFARYAYPIMPFVMVFSAYALKGLFSVETAKALHAFAHPSKQQVMRERYGFRIK